MNDIQRLAISVLLNLMGKPMFLLTLTNESDITIKSIKICNIFNAITTLVASSTLSDVVEAPGEFTSKSK